MRHGEVARDRARTAGGARSGAAVALTVICLATAARARDIIHLRDGQFLEGTVTRETDEAIWLTVGKSTVRLSRSRVKRIERGKPLPSWEARLRAKLREDRERRAAAALAAAEKTRDEKKTAASKKDDERIARLVAELASADADARREAQALLEREGAKAVPALTKGLAHANAFARESSARLLGRLGARQSVRAMIIAIRSAVPEKDKIRPWQRSFVRALRVSLTATTGQDFGVSLYGTHQSKAVEKYVEWWDGEDPGGAKEGGPAPKKGACISWDTPQVGEEPIAEDDPEREKKLWDARRIGRERRTYSPPKSFTDPFGEASGGE
ncbi:MAG: HEAT repeat domain-containing protein [Planctomycetota bacterium]|jgi:hypothetical protein